MTGSGAQPDTPAAGLQPILVLLSGSFRDARPSRLPRRLRRRSACALTSASPGVLPKRARPASEQGSGSQRGTQAPSTLCRLMAVPTGLPAAGTGGFPLGLRAADGPQRCVAHASRVGAALRRRSAPADGARADKHPAAEGVDVLRGGVGHGGRGAAAHGRPRAVDLRVRREDRLVDLVAPPPPPPARPRRAGQPTRARPGGAGHVPTPAKPTRVRPAGPGRAPAARESPRHRRPSGPHRRTEAPRQAPGTTPEAPRPPRLVSPYGGSRTPRAPASRPPPPGPARRG